MSAPKFTPGQWWVDASHYGTIYIEANAVIDKRLLQEICAVGPTESGREQQEANARLIAAAPKMHGALDELADAAAEALSCDHNDLCPFAQRLRDAVAQARAVLAKAVQP